MIPTINGAMHKPIFYIDVASPNAVPTKFGLTTYGTHPQIADAYIEYPIPVNINGYNS
jgi:hypothetical protein